LRGFIFYCEIYKIDSGEVGEVQILV